MQPSESIHLSSCLGPAQQVGPHSQNSKLIWGSHETAVLLFQAPLAVIAYPGIKNIWHCSIGNPLRLISIDKIENECKQRNKTGKRGWPKPFPNDRDMMPNNTANWPIPKEPKKQQTVHLHQQHQGPKRVLQPIQVLSHKEYVWMYQLLKPSPTKLVFFKTHQLHLQEDTNIIKSEISYLRASLLTSTTPLNPEPKSVESLLTAGCNS